MKCFVDKLLSYAIDIPEIPLQQGLVWCGGLPLHISVPIPQLEIPTWSSCTQAQHSIQGSGLMEEIYHHYIKSKILIFCNPTTLCGYKVVKR